MWVVRETIILTLGIGFGQMVFVCQDGRLDLKLVRLVETFHVGFVWAVACKAGRRRSKNE
jgi:hypothetical protein